MKKFAALLLVLVLCLSGAPLAALADFGAEQPQVKPEDTFPAEIDLSMGDITITVTGANLMSVAYHIGGGGQTGETTKQNIDINATTVTITGASASRTITVTDEVPSNSAPVKIQLKDLTGEQLALVGHAQVALTLLGNSSFTTKNADSAAVQVPAGCALTITEGSTGALTAKSEDGIGDAGNGAGIGGGKGHSGGSITINGGSVIATSGQGAGIGGGGAPDSDAGDGGNITINGGTVTATSQLGAGIGGGGGQSIGGIGSILISGGFVTATSTGTTSGGPTTYYAQDIGGAMGSTSGLSITGGSVLPTRLNGSNIDNITDAIAVSSAGPFPVAVPQQLGGADKLTGGLAVTVPLGGDACYTATTVTFDEASKCQHGDSFPFAALLWLQKNAYTDITVGDVTASVYVINTPWPWTDAPLLNTLYPYPFQVQLTADAGSKDLLITVQEAQITGAADVSGLMTISGGTLTNDLLLPVPGTQLSLSVDENTFAGTVTVDGGDIIHDPISILLSGLHAEQLVLKGGASVRLTLEGDNSFTPASADLAAVQVPEGCTLAITESSTGSLAATAITGAGIGGAEGGSSGVITIKGGTISAKSTYGAGIGGGGGQSIGGVGTISIAGGFVTATSGTGTPLAQDIGGAIGSTSSLNIVGGSVWPTHLNAGNIDNITDVIAINTTAGLFPVAVPASYGGNQAVLVPIAKRYDAQTVGSAAQHGADFPFGALLWLKKGHYADITVGSSTLWADVTASWPDGIRRNTAYPPILLHTVELSASATALEVGDAARVNTTLLPQNADVKTISWALSDPALASFNEATGTLTALAPGSVTLTATAGDGFGGLGVSGTIRFIISAKSVPVSSVGLVADASSLEVGGSAQVSATILPTDATDKSLRWQLAPAGLASFDAATGTLTALAPGSVTLTATAADGSGISDSIDFVISAKPVPVSSVTLAADTSSLEVGGNALVSATILPADATDKSLRWQLAPAGLASFDEAIGTLTALAPGNVTLTATAADGSDASGSLSFTITAPPGPPSNSDPNSDPDPDPDPTYEYRTITVPNTGVSVTGSFTPETTLTVTEKALHPKGSCTACDKIRAKGGWAVLYDVSITGGHNGDIKLHLPVDSRYNGENMTVWHCKRDYVEKLSGRVQNGVVTLTVSSLSPFAVFAAGNRTSDTSSLPDDTNVVAPQTGDNSHAGGWAALLAVSLLLALFAVWQLVKKRGTARR